MKERPILFNAPMVRATLDGKKTQTRRPVKVQPKLYGNKSAFPGQWMKPLPAGTWQHMTPVMNGTWASNSDAIRCPFGVPGDRLWVRETFVVFAGRAHHREGGNLHFDGKPYTGPWTPSIHMPRWASRLTLPITNIRVEKACDISEADAIAEGFANRDEFLATFAAIYGRADLWCWVVDFEVAR